MPEYKGSCHCGSVKFKIQSEIQELTTCDCSLCIKKNAVMTKVHEDDFVLLSSWEHVSEYKWNMKIARHFFCKHCGIYTFHRKRAQPDHYGVNIFCLDDFDSSVVKIRATKGDNMTVKATDARLEWQGPRTA
ncbi:MAG: GFA family protein [Robiginitomaculum sp.]|nr:GFA family protein [Robiginitomaculum sp.]